MNLLDDAMDQIGRLFKENSELRTRAENAERELADLREKIATGLDDVAGELAQRADDAGSDSPTGRTILLVQAETYMAAAERVRNRS